MYSVTRQILICKRVCDGDFLSTMTFLSLSKLYYGYIEQISSERHDLNRRNHSQSLEIAPENVVEATLSGRFDMKPCLRFMLITIFIGCGATKDAQIDPVVGRGSASPNPVDHFHCGS